MFQDLRLALRLLARHRGFTAIAVLTLAVGIGASITIFSVVNAVLLRALPYPQAERLVFLWSNSPQQNLNERPSGYANFSEWRTQNNSFEELTAFDPTSVTLTGTTEPEQVMSVRASANIFRVLAVTPALGRTFTISEEEEKARVVVLSHAIWQRRFGGSPNILRQTLEIDGVASQVIGVMPESFQFPGEENPIFEPLSRAANWEAEKTRRGTGSWRVIGRLKPSVSVSQVQSEMSLIAQRLEQAYPDTNKGLGVSVVPLHLQLTGSNVRLAIWILFGAVLFVLLIACANVANLMLARGLAREREIAIRMALGAGRLRVVRQLITESTLLAVIAGALGLFIAAWSIQTLRGFSAPNIPQLTGVVIDLRVLAFALGISFLTAALFGLAPALKVSQTRPGGALQEGRSAGLGIGARRLRGLLVVLEFSLAVILLSGAGLLLRSFIRLQAVEPGFDSNSVLVLQTAPPRNSTPDQLRGFYRQVRERLAALPGVEAVGLGEEILISGNPDGLITIEGDSADKLTAARVPFRHDVITEGFLETLRVPLRQGRFFGTEDNQGGLPVTIINETMARRLWPGAPALGKRFKLGDAQSSNPWLTVVGVVGDMRRQSLERESIAQMFLPYRQSPERRMNLLVRTVGEPGQLAAAVRNEIRSIDKTVLIYGVGTLDTVLARGTAQRRFQTWLLTTFS
ncbi:MAG TPA: ABC transporter permease, partial [Pyrinomonadaceae bacterium]|nr:ABC transporter permease [Pyrinomonadaceae bacterium]